jgi:hypothetical protein
VAEVVKCQLSKCKALSSILVPIITKNNQMLFVLASMELFEFSSSLLI